jgi:hypothetical protein
MDLEHQEKIELSRRMAAGCALGFAPEIFKGRLSLEGGRHGGLVRHHILRVSAELTPGIEESVKIACNNLGFPRALLEVYVSPQKDTNAFSSRDLGRALVVINSALVEILSKDELTFVVGHELGHFLLPEINQNDDESLESAILSRRAELTMDRIGLLACRDVTQACQAKLKMLSGLTERHLRMDVAALISEWNALANDEGAEQLQGSSHPPPGLRAKALLRFHSTEYFRNICGNSGGTTLSEANNAILEELVRFVDGSAERTIRDSLNKLSGWAAGFAASHGIKVRLASFRTNQCDAPEDYVRRCIGVIIQDTPEADRKEKALRKFHEYLTAATSVAPIRTSGYLSHIAKEEPALGDIISRIRIIK